MSSGLIDQAAAHPLVQLVGALEQLVDEQGSAPAWTLTPHQLGELLPRLVRARNRLDAVELALLREADRHQVGDLVGAASTAGWFATTTRTTRPAAHQAVALAASLDADAHEPTRTAMTNGHVSRAQASVIVHAVEALPTDLVTAALRTDAEKHLVALAAHHDPRELRLLGRRILDVLAPQVAEEHERRVLEAEEQHAAATSTFTMRPDGHGSMIGRFKIPTLAGQILAKHLNALAAPKHRHALGSPGFDTVAAQPAQPTEGRVTRPLRLGAAFTEYIETRSPKDTPRAGGVAATLVVTMTLTDLLGDHQAATLDTGERISASEARRLACEAGIIPAVLGSTSVPLDLGRKTRLHTPTQRHALALRDRGCRAEHCDWPPALCHAHHTTPWARGGPTNITNGMLLCPRHHTLAHDARYEQARSPAGKVRFIRRT